MIRFSVPGSPIAQPRQRSSLIRTKTGREFIHNYTPAKAFVNVWKATIKFAAERAWIKNPRWLTGEAALRLSAIFYLPRPASLCRKKDPEGPLPCLRKPDAENLAKALMDALTGVLYADDKQVCVLEVRKFYPSKGEAPRTDIELEEA